MTTPCVLELEGVPIPVWQAEFTTAVIHGGGAGGPGGPAAWGSITGTLSAQVDLSAALAGKLSAASNLGDLASAAAARINLGLGSAAQSAASSFATAAQGGKADTALQPGAGLSAIDSAAANKLASVQAGAQVNAVASVAGKTGSVTLVAADISGLGALATKSTVAVADVSASGTPGAGTFLRGDGAWAVPPAGGGGGAAAWGGITGTLGDQADLSAALNAKANTATLAAVATAGTYASLTGKPTLGTAAASSTSDFAAASHSHAASAISDSTATGRALLTTANAAAARATLGLGSAATSALGDFATAAQGVKADSAVQPAGLAPYAKTADLPPVPTNVSQLINDSGFVSDISGKVDKVAGKGLSTEDYSSAEKTKLAGIATGATANAADADLRDRVTHTGSQAIATVTGLQSALDAKQPLLVSGSNIKTVNGQALLGGGDLVIAGGGGAAPTDLLAPVNTTPASGATGIGAQPALVCGPYYELYGAAQAAIQVQLHTANVWTTPLHDSGEKPAATSYLLPAGLLVVGTTYWWRARYKSARAGWGDWSTPTSFTTAASFGHYVAAPPAISPAVGDPLGGGYYAGQIWNEVTQSATSTTIGTGAKTFTVPDMTTNRLFYEGQQVEVRSRGTPTTKMVGTVTGAFGSSLTVTVTSTSGSGTLIDWSIMAVYRIICAPKAGGEHSGIALKNANTLLPADCETAAEGALATAAMVAADSSTVYPAAWWAKGLSIGGYTDWYVPARDEMYLCYAAFKSGPTANVVQKRADYGMPTFKTRGAYGDVFPSNEGTSLNTVPQRPANTSTVPPITPIAAFAAGGSEAFTEADYTTVSDRVEYPENAVVVHMGTCAAAINYKSTNRRVRAARRMFA